MFGVFDTSSVILLISLIPSVARRDLSSRMRIEKEGRRGRQGRGRRASGDAVPRNGIYWRTMTRRDKHAPSHFAGGEERHRHFASSSRGPRFIIRPESVRASSSSSLPLSSRLRKSRSAF